MPKARGNDTTGLLSAGVNPGVAGFEGEGLSSPQPSSVSSSDDPRLASYSAPMTDTQEKLFPAWIDMMAREQEHTRKREYERHVRDMPEWALTQVALIVRDAIHGRRLSMFTTPKSVWWYERYHSSWYGVLYSVVIVAMCLLPLWEHPSSLRNFPSENADVCKDSITYTVEAVLIAVLMADVWVRVRVSGLLMFWRSNYNKLAVFIVCFMACNLITERIAACSFGVALPRLQRLLRPFLPIARYRNIQKIWGATIVSMPGIIKVFTLLMFEIGFFAIFAVVLFAGQRFSNDNIEYGGDFLNATCKVLGDGTDSDANPDNPRFQSCSTWNQDCTDYYNTPHEALNKLFIVITTANFPDVMLPQYHCNRWYGWFFVVFLTIGLLFLMNLILAVAYEQFQSRTRKSVQNRVRSRFTDLDMAYKLLMDFVARRGMQGNNGSLLEIGCHDDSELRSQTSPSSFPPARDPRDSAAAPKKRSIGIELSDFADSAQAARATVAAQGATASATAPAPRTSTSTSSSTSTSTDDSLPSSDGSSTSGSKQPQPLGATAADLEEGFDEAVWDLLVEELRRRGVMKDGGASEKARRVLFRCLDQDSGGTISQKEFRALLGIVEVSVTPRSGKPPYFGPGSTNKWLHTRARAWIRHKMTERCWDALVYINSALTVWFIALDQADGQTALDDTSTAYQGAASSTKDLVQSLLTGMLLLFVVELGTKIYVDGMKRYWHEDVFNKVDFVAITVGFALFIMQSLLDLNEEDQRLVSLARLFRAVRLLGRLKAFKPLVKTFTVVFPGFLTHFTVLLIFFQLFAVLGMELFAGLIGTKQQMCCPPGSVAPCPCAATLSNATGPLDGMTALQVDEVVGRGLGISNSSTTVREYLESVKCDAWSCNSFDYSLHSSFGKSHYWNLNFNSFSSAHVVLFYLMIVNNWPVVMEGYVATAGFAARLFFYLWYMVIVLVVLNIVLAFLLDAFAAQALVWEELSCGKQPLWRIMVHSAAKRANLDISRCDVKRKRHFRDMQEALYMHDIDEEVEAITGVASNKVKSANETYNLAELSHPRGAECASMLEISSAELEQLLLEITESDRASLYPGTKDTCSLLHNERASCGRQQPLTGGDGNAARGGWGSRPCASSSDASSNPVTDTEQRSASAPGSTTPGAKHHTGRKEPSVAKLHAENF